MNRQHKLCMVLPLEDLLSSRGSLDSVNLIVMASPSQLNCSPTIGNHIQSYFISTRLLGWKAIYLLLVLMIPTGVMRKYCASLLLTCCMKMIVALCHWQTIECSHPYSLCNSWALLWPEKGDKKNNKKNWWFVKTVEINQFIQHSLILATLVCLIDWLCWWYCIMYNV